MCDRGVVSPQVPQRRLLRPRQRRHVGRLPRLQLRQVCREAGGRIGGREGKGLFCSDNASEGPHPRQVQQMLPPPHTPHSRRTRCVALLSRRGELAQSFVVLGLHRPRRALVLLPQPADLLGVVQPAARPSQPPQQKLEGGVCIVRGGGKDGTPSLRLLQSSDCRSLHAYTDTPLYHYSPHLNCLISSSVDSSASRCCCRRRRLSSPSAASCRPNSSACSGGGARGDDASQWRQSSRQAARGCSRVLMARAGN